MVFLVLLTNQAPAASDYNLLFATVALFKEADEMS